MNAIIKVNQNNSVATKSMIQLPKKISQDNRIKTLFQGIKGYPHIDLKETQDRLESLRFLTRKSCKQVYKSVHLQNPSKQTAQIPSFTTKPKREKLMEEDIGDIKNELKDLMSIRKLKCYDIEITDDLFEGIDDSNHITDYGIVLLIRFLLKKCQGLDNDSFCVIESPSALQLPFCISGLGADVRLIEEIKDWQSKDSILLPILIRQDKPEEEEDDDDNDDDEMNSGHWVLLVLYPKQKYLVLYDSEPHKNITEDNKTPPYIALVVAHFEINGWNACLQAYGNLPQQTAHHCGLYMMYFMLCIISKTPIGSFTDEHAVNMRKWLFEMILDNHTNCGPRDTPKVPLVTQVEESSPQKGVLETENEEMQVASPRRIKVKVPKEFKVTNKIDETLQEAPNLESNVDEEADYGLEYTDESDNEENESKKDEKPNFNESKNDTSKGKRKQRLPLHTEGKRRKSNNDGSTRSTKETSDTESKKSDDEEQEAIHQCIREALEKMKIQQLRRDQGLEIEDDFCGDSMIWIQRQINYYINQAKKKRGINTAKRDSVESQMSTDNNDATNTQSAVLSQEILSSFKPEYRTKQMLKQQDYLSAMSYLAGKTIDRESELELKIAKAAKKKMKILASHQYDKLVKIDFGTISPEEMQQLLTKRISNKKKTAKIKQLEKEILEAKTSAERLKKTHELFELLNGVAYKCTKENKEEVQKESCKDMSQTSDGLLFTNKPFRNSSELRAQMTPELQKKYTEERKKAEEAEKKKKRERREKQKREIELENKERLKKLKEKEEYEKEVEAKRKAGRKKAEKLFKKYYEPIMAARAEEQQNTDRPKTREERKRASRLPIPFEEKVNTQMGKDFSGKSAHNKKTPQEVKEISAERYKPSINGIYNPHFEIERKYTKNGKMQSTITKRITVEYMEHCFDFAFLELCKMMKRTWVAVPLGSSGVGKGRKFENKIIDNGLEEEIIQEEKEIKDFTTDHNDVSCTRMKITQDYEDLVVTRMKVFYKQGKQDNCLNCEIGSVLVSTKLNYFKSLAGKIMLCRDSLSKLDLFRALTEIVELTKKEKQFNKELTCKMYLRRLNGKLLKKPDRKITMQDLIENPKPFPVIVVPLGSDGSIDHCFGLIDGLVFDPQHAFAAKASEAAFHRACHPAKAVDLFCVLRFEPQNKTSFKRKLRDITDLY